MGQIQADMKLNGLRGKEMESTYSTLWNTQCRQLSSTLGHCPHGQGQEQRGRCRGALKLHDYGIISRLAKTAREGM